MTCSAIAVVVVLGVVYELPTMPISPAAADLARGSQVTAQALVSREGGRRLNQGQRVVRQSQ